MTYEEMMASLPQIQLNEQQQAAVKAVEGPVLLLAVPGSGKTTTMVVRLGYMIGVAGIPADRIMTVTFGKKAAEEMQERYRRFFGERQMPTFRTINALCLRIITAYEAYSGRSFGVSLIAEAKRNELLSVLYRKYEGHFPLENERNAVSSAITCKKNLMIPDDELEQFAFHRRYNFPFKEIYTEYCRELERNRWIDFDDQMVMAHRLLTTDPIFLQKIQRKYRYYCVDEAQDTSYIQHEILRLLVAEHHNLFMVGDEDQSIYGFRGAYPQSLLQFQKTYPEARVLYSESNYRSSADILTVANAFISRNEHRQPKSLVPTKGRDGGVHNIVLPSDACQYDYLVEIASRKPLDTAVLCRDNESMIPLLHRLQLHGVPYRAEVGSDKSFQSRVITDFLTFFEYADHPNDEELFQRVARLLAVPLSEESIVRAKAFAKEWQVPLYKTLPYIVFGKKKKALFDETKERMKEIVAVFSELPTFTGKQTVERLSGCGYQAYLEKKGFTDLSRLRILKTIADDCSTAKDLCHRLATLNDCLIKHNLTAEQWREAQSRGEGVLLVSTVHKAKGMEYDTVYLMDVIDGKFPSGEEDDENYEEERRLFYVAVTRAKRELNVFTFKKVFQDAECSFSREIFQPPKTQLNPEFVAKVVVGAKVNHQKYGDGRIVTFHRTTGRFSVLFPVGEKEFSFPSAFTKGYLKLYN